MNEITFGMRLKIAMILADVVPKELGDLTGISTSTIYQYRNDPTPPPTDRMLQIAKALDDRCPGCASILIASGRDAN